MDISIIKWQYQCPNIDNIGIDQITLEIALFVTHMFKYLYIYIVLFHTILHTYATKIGSITKEG